MKSRPKFLVVALVVAGIAMLAGGYVLGGALAQRDNASTSTAG